MVFAGEGIAEIAPENGTVLAGFHYPPQKERKTTAIRQTPKIRALALRVNDTTAIILAVDVICFARDICAGLQKRIEEVTGVRAAIVSTGSERDDTIIREDVLRLW